MTRACASRYPGDTEWTELDTLVPVPAEWAGQDLAGRDEAESLEGLLSGTGGMSDGLNGWFVFAIGHGVGGADTYVYRTRDGGRTWQETGRPDPGPDEVVPLLHLFHRQLHWLPGSELFQRRSPSSAPLTAASPGRRSPSPWRESGSCPPCAPAARMS